MIHPSVNDIEVGTLPGGTRVFAASIASGKILLTQTDPFVEQQSSFDRQARVKIELEVMTVTPEIYLDYVASQIMAWSDQELAALKTIVNSSIQDKFGALQFSLPNEVWLVKTSGLEEGYAAYTRGLNVIALPVNMVNSLTVSAGFNDPLHPGSDFSYLENVIIHECFHLFSKNNPTRRWELYEQVHYLPLSNPVSLPPVPWPNADSPDLMPTLRITNPDTPLLDTYITLTVPSDPQNPASPMISRQLLPILMSSGRYHGGSFFDTLEWLFLAIDFDKETGIWQDILTADNRPCVYPMEPGTPLYQQYLNLIGLNLSEEIFHPDEILAQNFVFVANLPSLNTLTSMKQVLGNVSSRGKK